MNLERAVILFVLNLCQTVATLAKCVKNEVRALTYSQAQTLVLEEIAQPIFEYDVDVRIVA